MKKLEHSCFCTPCPFPTLALFPPLPNSPKLRILGPDQFGMLSYNHSISLSTKWCALRKYKVKNIQISHLLQGFVFGWNYSVLWNRMKGWEEASEQGFTVMILKRVPKNWSLHREEKKTTTQSCRTGEILTAKKWYCSGEFSRKNKTPFNNWPAGMSYRGIN